MARPNHLVRPVQVGADDEVSVFIIREPYVPIGPEAIAHLRIRAPEGK